MPPFEVVFTYFFSISLKSRTNSEPNTFSITGNSAHLPPRDFYATEPLNELLPLGIIQLFPKASGGRIPGKSINRSIERSFNKITNYGKSVQVAQAAQVGEPLAG